MKAYIQKPCLLNNMMRLKNHLHIMCYIYCDTGHLCIGKLVLELQNSIKGAYNEGILIEISGELVPYFEIL